MQGPDWVGEEFAAPVQERRGQQVQSSQRRQEPGARRGLISLCTRSSACDPGLVWKLWVDMFSFLYRGVERHPLCLATVWIKCHQN